MGGDAGTVLPERLYPASPPTLPSPSRGEGIGRKASSPSGRKGLEGKVIPIQTVRYVDEEQVRKVPVQTVRYVEEQQVRQVPVTTCRTVYEEHVEQVPVLP